MTGGLFAIPEGLRNNFTWLDHKDIKKLAKAFEIAGGELRFVGGVVRDSLIGGLPVTFGKADFDLATTLRPEETFRALDAAKIRAIPTGLGHGTITAVIAGRLYEITSLRADVITDGRHAKVAFTTDWNEDWQRRDFTINAIYLTMEGQLFDPAQGLADIAQKKVRFIGNAPHRIIEDYLRILRFYRCSAFFAEDLDEEGRAACKAHAKGLEQIALERISVELKKLCTVARAPDFLRAMREDNIFPPITDTMPDIDQVKQLYDLASPEIPSFPTVLCAAWPETMNPIAQDLRLSRKEYSMMVTTSKAAYYADEITTDNAKAVLYRYGKEAFIGGVLLNAIWRGRYDKAAVKKILTLPDNWAVPVFPVNGKVLSERGVKAGPAMGRTLKRAESLWIDADFPSDQKAIVAILAEAI